MAWGLFAEPITVVTLVGTALTAAGVSLVVRATR
jgi:drug/metabolite transporter (DMT)-like permease